jgi:hypothetical protein
LQTCSRGAHHRDGHTSDQKQRTEQSGAYTTCLAALRSFPTQTGKTNSGTMGLDVGSYSRQGRDDVLDRYGDASTFRESNLDVTCAELMKRVANAVTACRKPLEKTMGRLCGNHVVDSYVFQSDRLLFFSTRDWLLTNTAGHPYINGLSAWSLRDQEELCGYIVKVAGYLMEGA